MAPRVADPPSTAVAAAAGGRAPSAKAVQSPQIPVLHYRERAEGGGSVFLLRLA